jgi:Tfp pilus assembly protein PilN
MIDVLKKKRASSVLGLALDGSRLEGVVLRRSNGSLHVQQSFAVSLALNPLTGDPELVGREIRNHLDHAGIRERRCAVCVPLSSALTLLTEVPDLPDEDVAGFLQIEAERGFPYGQEALFISTLRLRSPGGKQHVASVALPRSNVLALERALRAAQLKPVSFSLGIPALQSPQKESSHGVLALVIGENTVDLQVTCGGGIVALRALDEAFETEGMEKHLSADFLAREIKITLGQLPAEFRDKVRQARIFGRGHVVQRFVTDIMPRLASMGLNVEEVERYPENEFARRLPPEAKVSPALSLAARYLTDTGPALEFLPPKTRPWQRLTTRFSSRKVAWASAAAGAAVLLGGGAFLFQQWQLSRLQTQWAAMEPKVKELDNMQQQIKKFRPWFDGSFRSLSILRKLAESFPEEGVVTAKTLEIRELSSITCSGTARDNQAFLRMLDQLRAAKEVTDVKVDQVRGTAPMQFTFNFHWGERANEN